MNLTFPELPFRDYDTFYNYWKREGMSGTGSWQKRRDYLDKLFGSLYTKLDDLEEQQLKSRLATPVSPRRRLGWIGIDAEIEQLRHRFASATTSQDYSSVGTACVRILEALGEIVYDPERHLREGEQVPSRDKTKQRIGRYVEAELVGSESAELRSLANATIALAHQVKHRRTPDRCSTGIAADSVILLANILRRLREDTRVRDGS